MSEINSFFNAVWTKRSRALHQVLALKPLTMDFHIDHNVGPRKKPRVATQPLAEYETATFTECVVYTCESGPQHVDGPAGAPGSAPAGAADGVPDDAPDDASDTESVPDDMTATQFYKRFVERTPEACSAELAAPQRSVEWLEARKHAITASNFGAAAGHNKYQSPSSLVVDKLWNTFQGNEATRYGTFHEPDARRTLEALLAGPLRATLVNHCQASTGAPADAIDATLQYDLFETGLLKHAQQPWMAVSPDGLLRLHSAGGAAFKGAVWLLVEYKCPARLRDSEDHPYKKNMYNVPEYYMDQIQGIMGLFNKFPDLLDLGARSVGVAPLEAAGPSGAQTGGPQAALFVVWQPHQVHVTRVPFQEDYYSGTLEPALASWYFEHYLPLATLKHNGLLKPGTDCASAPLTL